MSVLEVSQYGRKVLIVFETEDEALVHAPAIHALMFEDNESENKKKLKFITMMFGKDKGQQIKDLIGIDETFEIAKRRLGNTFEGFYNV